MYIKGNVPRLRAVEGDGAKLSARGECWTGEKKRPTAGACVLYGSAGGFLLFFSCDRDYSSMAMGMGRKIAGVPVNAMEWKELGEGGNKYPWLVISYGVWMGFL